MMILWVMQNLCTLLLCTRLLVERYIDHVLCARATYVASTHGGEGSVVHLFRSSLSFHMFENGLEQDDAQMCAKFFKPCDKLLLPQEEGGCVLCFVDDFWKVAPPVANKEYRGMRLLEVRVVVCVCVSGKEK